jgi:hypothetical protein
MQVLVAFETGMGLVYARVAGWNHIYLLWTFRNFSSLPQTTLNRRQQKLISDLYQTASVMRQRDLEAAAVIGTVEEFSLPSPVVANVAAEPAAHGFLEATAACGQQAGGAFPIRPAIAGLTLRIAAGALLIFIAAAFAWYH